MNIAQYPLIAGDTLAGIEGTRIGCLWPPDNFTDWGRDSTNGQSIVIRAQIGNAACILPGDLPAWAESLLVVQGAELRSQLLIAGHHGSRNSNSIAWLAAVSPEMVAISCGRYNSYGHPDPEMLARVSAAGCTNVMRTDQNGTLTLRTNGWGWDSR